MIIYDDMIFDVHVPIPRVKLVPKRNELFADQYDESLDSPVVRVHQHLSEGTQLTRAVPPIRAMGQHTTPIHVNVRHNSTRGGEDGGDVVQPVRVGDVTPLGLAWVPPSAHLAQSLERFSHYVDVGDAAVLERRVGI